MSNHNKHPFFAEVIESSLDHYTGQSWDWRELPPFGSLVSVQDKNLHIIGVVTQAQTGSMDPARTPFAYQKTEEELLREQPQIFAFLRTTFTVQVCGHISLAEPERLVFAIPPTPPRIHAFISQSDGQLAKRFFSNAHFLDVLYGFSNVIPNVDELLLAILKNSKDQGLLTSALLEDVCHGFSLLTGNDYRRLKIFLGRVQQLQ
ncbi:hypothetical protein EBZ39_08945 [bacterium]|nr:hypothetical protein [bacterium]